MSSLLEKALKKIEDSNNIQEEEEIQKDDKPIEIKDLKPPKPPKPNKEIFDEISFEEIANSSEFKRLVYLIQFGKTHRGKSVDLERKLVKRQQEIKIIREYERGTHGDFRNVVKELKEKLAKRKEIVENGTN